MNRLWAYFVFALACAVCCSACTEFRSGVVPCASSADCPSGWVCDAESGRCVEGADSLLELPDTPADTVDDPGCACGAGLYCCEDACVDLSADPGHCGSCATPCGPGEDCDAGACLCVGAPDTQWVGCEAVAGSTCCASLGCVDVRTDAQACGTCGLACNPGERCTGALCACGSGLPCPSGTVCCGEACCGFGELCCDGACHPPTDQACQCGDVGVCSPTQLCCEGDVGEACVEPLSDMGHCGGCGLACQAHQTCSSGQCKCVAGFGDCDGDAATGCEVAIGTDAENCGACGRRCAEGSSCVDGRCACAATGGPCLVGEACCASGCVDTASAVDHCGSCGQACPAAGPGAASVDCVEGRCVAVCEADRADCNGIVADGCETSTSANNEACGGCAPCGPGEQCVGGVCTCGSGTCQCSAGQRFCDGQCVDLLSDAAHCGACGVGCTGGQVCTSGMCACPAGQEDCDGTCVALGSDAAHCGACGASCGSHPGVASATCSLGACVYTCAAGQANCTTALGCETALGTPTNCSACGDACVNGRVCAGGMCVCPSGQVVCDGRCVDLTVNASHCGACGNSCPSGFACSAGSCACPAGTVQCGGGCVDIQTNGSHCGFCGAVCQAGTTCQSGACRCPDGNPLATTSNCAFCGNACTGGQVCSGGACKCPSGTVLCGSVCVDTASDESNCGACGRVCGAGQTCCSGVCRNLASEVGHCGACGRACVDDGNTCTQTACSNGSCQHLPVAAGVACASGMCNGAGSCVQCMQDSHCSDGNRCTTDRCVGSSCSHPDAHQTAVVQTSWGRDGFCELDQSGNAISGGYQRVEALCSYTETEPFSSRGYLAFDTSGIPSGVWIESATLSACSEGGPGSEPATLWDSAPLSIPLDCPQAAGAAATGPLLSMPQSVGDIQVGLPTNAIDPGAWTFFQLRYPDVCAPGDWAGRRWISSTGNAGDTCPGSVPWVLSVTYCGAPF